MRYPIRSIPAALRRAWREARSDADAHYRGYTEVRESLRDAGIAEVSQLRILEVGCGERAPLALLFATEGALVDAIDILPIALGWRRPAYWASLASHGRLSSAFRAIVHDVLHTFRYWRRLGDLAGAKLPFDRVHPTVGDASDLPFADDTFDIIVSAAVWEHLPDITAATREVNRCLKPDGLASIHVALFPALTGGHHGEWHTIDPRIPRHIRPWDHLYPEHLPLPVFLNELREADYRLVFERELSVVTWREAPLEGEAYLTEQARRRLSSYSERDLLLSWVSAIARKRHLRPPDRDGS